MLPAQKQNYTTIAQMMERNRDSIAAALPKHLTAERLSRVALGELRTNPRLLDCNPTSLMSAIVKASQLGLEVGSAMGHAYLVPYKTECTLIIGYRGMIALARRSGEIQSITARVVYARDTFELEYGLEEKLRHIPSTDEDPGQVTHVYAVAKLRDGGIQYEVMTRAEVEAVRKRSRAGGNGPWVTDWSEMARKTVMRRLFKYLPMSIEMADAMAAEVDEDRLPERAVAATVVDLNTHLAASVERDSPVAGGQQPPVAPQSPEVGEPRQAADHHPSTGPSTSADAASAPSDAAPSTDPEQAPQESGANLDDGDGAVDARGIPWDERIHSSSRGRTADGSWRRKRGVDPMTVERIERELMAEGDPTTNPPSDEIGQAQAQTQDQPDAPPLTIDRILAGISAAEDSDTVDEWVDLSRDINPSVARGDQIRRAANERCAYLEARAART
ncbi:recombination protein RecT [Marichromatium gracile]|uniref:recombination protein RecT n=1 Tax=Marichromatium gracile TaxID=1048 RepID=UPI0009EDFB75|nr:recombination protein RecT [Marichromatium gracile]